VIEILALGACLPKKGRDRSFSFEIHVRIDVLPGHHCQRRIHGLRNWMLLNGFQRQNDGGLAVGPHAVGNAAVDFSGLDGFFGFGNEIHTENVGLRFRVVFRADCPHGLGFSSDTTTATRMISPIRSCW